MKKLSFVCLSFSFLFILSGCNKPKTESPKEDIVHNGRASYSAWADAYFWSSAYSASIDSSNGITSCRLERFISDSGKYSGQVYDFDFADTTGRNFALRFAIPASNYPSFKFPLNNLLSFKFDSDYWSSIPSISAIFFAYNEIVSDGNRGTVSLTITRVSDKTIDGKFSLTIQRFSTLSTTPLQNATVTNGTFYNVPIKTDL